MIVDALREDSKRLTEIALKSKSYWNYSEKLIESWRGDLTVTSEMFQTCSVFKFLFTSKTVGFYMLNSPKGKIITLEMLFVLPGFIGKGIGKQLLLHSFEEAKKRGVEFITLLADPNAVSFYSSQGFYQTDEKESSIPNRFLSVMQKDLKK